MTDGAMGTTCPLTSQSQLQLSNPKESWAGTSSYPHPPNIKYSHCEPQVNVGIPLPSTEFQKTSISPILHPLLEAAHVVLSIKLSQIWGRGTWLRLLCPKLTWNPVLRLVKRTVAPFLVPCLSGWAKRSPALTPLYAPLCSEA